THHIHTRGYIEGPSKSMSAIILSSMSLVTWQSVPMESLWTTLDGWYSCPRGCGDTFLLLRESVCVPNAQRPYLDSMNDSLVHAPEYLWCRPMRNNVGPAKFAPEYEGKTNMSFRLSWESIACAF